MDGQSHLMTEESGCDVAEVSAGHADHQLVCQSLLLHACIGVEVVESLRQESCHIDRVGRGELHVLVEFLVHESRLDKRLAVVEHAIHFEGCDVLSEGGELAFLNLAYLPLRIEHIDVNAVNTEESIGYSRTCIARSSNEHVDFLLAFLTHEVLQQTGHEARAYILEGEGRAMEELQRVDVWLYLYHRAVESQCVVDDLLQRLSIDVLAEEGVSHLVGNLLEGEFLDVVEKVLWQLLDDFGHVETTVFCQSFYYRLVKIGDGCFLIC